MVQAQMQKTVEFENTMFNLIKNQHLSIQPQYRSSSEFKKKEQQFMAPYEKHGYALSRQDISGVQTKPTNADVGSKADEKRDFLLAELYFALKEKTANTKNSGNKNLFKTAMGLAGAPVGFGDYSGQQVYAFPGNKMVKNEGKGKYSIELMDQDGDKINYYKVSFSPGKNGFEVTGVSHTVQ
jgi:hypothetical protein